MSFLYLATLLSSIAGLTLLDFSHKLAVAKTKRNAFIILGAVVFFLVWDVVGISLGVFFRGDSPNLTGLLIYEELPVEEIFFLVVLSYTSLLLLKAFERLGKK